MKKTVLCIFLLSLGACGGGSTDTGGETEVIGSVVTTSDSVKITGDGSTTTINSVVKRSLSISGNYNLVYVQVPIKTLDIVGIGNQIEVSNGVTVDDCIVVGNDNSVIGAVSIACNVTGENNEGFVDIP